MKFRVLKNLLCLAFAAVAAGAWDLHLIGPVHEAGENCQVCAVASAPELNADCGSDLLPLPGGFVLLEPELPQLENAAPSLRAFRGRAPPLV